MKPTYQERIWQVIHAIPAGKVSTYGAVATMAGLPRQARAVGRCLSQLPGDSKIPWHRVINAQGKISFPLESERFCRQKNLLEEELIIFSNNRVNLKQFLWRPG
ncbi:MAG: MGMT family protein [Oceanospirillaceae bacterium]|nr:MGMT family protein [Oceanospirillaceae bacterium]